MHTIDYAVGEQFRHVLPSILPFGPVISTQLQGPPPPIPSLPIPTTDAHPDFPEVLLSEPYVGNVLCLYHSIQRALATPSSSAKVVTSGYGDEQLPRSGSYSGRGHPVGGARCLETPLPDVYSRYTGTLSCIILQPLASMALIERRRTDRMGSTASETWQVPCPESSAPIENLTSHNRQLCSDIG